MKYIKHLFAMGVFTLLIGVAMPAWAVISCPPKGNIVQPNGIDGDYYLRLGGLYPKLGAFAGTIIWDSAHPCPKPGVEYGPKYATAVISSHLTLPDRSSPCILTSPPPTSMGVYPPITCDEYYLDNKSPYIGDAILNGPNGCTASFGPIVADDCPVNLQDVINLNFNSTCILQDHGQCRNNSVMNWHHLPGTPAVSGRFSTPLTLAIPNSGE